MWGLKTACLHVGDDLVLISNPSRLEPVHHKQTVKEGKHLAGFLEVVLDINKAPLISPDKCLFISKQSNGPPCIPCTSCAERVKSMLTLVLLV